MLGGYRFWRSAYMALSVLFLAGCSSRATDPGLGRPPGVAVIRLEVEPDRLNPVLATTSSAMQVYNNLFSYLLTFDPVSLSYRPQLAEAQPEVMVIDSGPYAGGKDFAFRIHDAAVWDDGSPVTGSDFAFTLKVLFNPAVPAARYRAYLSFIRDVVVSEEDPKSFVVRTDRDFIQAVEYIGNAIPVLPAHLYDPEQRLAPYTLADLTDPGQAESLAADDALKAFAESFAGPRFSREPEGVSGSGPYRLEAWASGTSLRLRKKEGWWGDALADAFPTLRAFPAGMEFVIIPDGTSATAALKAEELDVAYNLDPGQFLELQQDPLAADRYQFFSPPQNAYYFIYVNQRQPLLEDERVRQALARAIDVQAIIDGVYKGFGERLAGPVHPSSAYHHPGLAPYPHEPERARELLAEAGWNDSDNNGILDRSVGGQEQELRLEYTFAAQRETSRNAALLIQDDLRQVGIDLDLRPVEASELFNSLRSGEYDLVSAGRTLTLTLWNPKQEYHSLGEDRTGFGSPDTDRLIDAILVTTDTARQRRLYMDLQSHIYQGVPEIPLFTPTGRIAVHNRYDAVLSPAYPNILFARLKLKEGYPVTSY